MSSIYISFECLLLCWGLFLGVPTNALYVRMVVCIVLLPWSVLVGSLVGTLLALHIYLCIHKLTTIELVRGKYVVAVVPKGTEKTACRTRPLWQDMSVEDDIEQLEMTAEALITLSDALQSHETYH